MGGRGLLLTLPVQIDADIEVTSDERELPQIDGIAGDGLSARGALTTLAPFTSRLHGAVIHSTWTDAGADIKSRTGGHHHTKADPKLVSGFHADSRLRPAQ